MYEYGEASEAPRAGADRREAVRHRQQGFPKGPQALLVETPDYEIILSEQILILGNIFQPLILNMSYRSSARSDCSYTSNNGSGKEFDFKQEVQKAREATIRKILREDIYLAFRNGDYDKMETLGIYTTEPEVKVLDYLSNYREDARKPHKSDIVLIVVNTDKDNLPALIAAVANFTKRVWMQKAKYMYSYEKHTATGNHLHVNILITDHNKYPSDIKREATASFKHTYSNPKSIHYTFRSGNEKEHLDNFRNYVAGIKADPEKQDQINKDKQWRQDNNLQDTYYHNMDTVPHQQNCSERKEEAAADDDVPSKFEDSEPDLEDEFDWSNAPDLSDSDNDQY